ncbi:MAG: hypothetical protein M3M97_05785 [Actinomycetota bacterium]|nr:hypothetical protein [Actinomycetota bacterium]
MCEQFTQNYTPLGNVYVPAIFAVIPIVVLSLMLWVLRTAANSGQSYVTLRGRFVTLSGTSCEVQARRSL